MRSGAVMYAFVWCWVLILVFAGQVSARAAQVQQSNFGEAVTWNQEFHMNSRLFDSNHVSYFSLLILKPCDCLVALQPSIHLNCEIEGEVVTKINSKSSQLKRV